MIPFLNLSRFHKQIIAASADLVLLPLTFCLAIWLRHDNLNNWLLHQYGLLILATPLISIPIFIKLGLYRAVIRFIDHKIVYVVVFGVTLSVIALGALGTFTQTAGYSRAVFGIYWVSAILYVTASRFLARGYLLRASGTIGAVPVVIYGAGQAGTQLASALRAGNEYLPGDDAVWTMRYQKRTAG